MCFKPWCCLCSRFPTCQKGVWSLQANYVVNPCCYYVWIATQNSFLIFRLFCQGKSWGQNWACHVPWLCHHIQYAVPHSTSECKPQDSIFPSRSSSSPFLTSPLPKAPFPAWSCKSFLPALCWDCRNELNYSILGVVTGCCTIKSTRKPAVCTACLSEPFNKVRGSCIAHIWMEM